jgi:hypothetical protein
MATGFVDRIKGKIIDPAASLTQFGAGGAVFRNGGNIYSNQSASGLGMTSTTSEVVLDSFTLPANSLDVPGRELYIYAFGSTASNTHAKTMKLYFGTAGGSTSTFVTSSVASASWVLQMVVQKDAANSQIISSQAISGTSHSGCTTAAGTMTDTGPITIQVTGQTGTAGANDVTLNGWMITGLN